MIELYRHQIWYSLAYPLWWVEFENPPTWKMAKSSITRPRIDRSRSNLVHSLITWYPTYHTFSRLTVTAGQEFAKLSITQPRIVQFRSNSPHTRTTTKFQGQAELFSLGAFVLSQCTRLTDGQTLSTDGWDGQTSLRLPIPRCIQCSAVKTACENITKFTP